MRRRTRQNSHESTIKLWVSLYCQAVWMWIGRSPWSLDVHELTPSLVPATAAKVPQKKTNKPRQRRRRECRCCALQRCAQWQGPPPVLVHVECYILHVGRRALQGKTNNICHVIPPYDRVSSPPFAAWCIHHRWYPIAAIHATSNQGLVRSLCWLDGSIRFPDGYEMCKLNAVEG